MYGMRACPVLFCIDLVSGRTVLKDEDTKVITEDPTFMPIVDLIKGGVKFTYEKRLLQFDRKRRDEQKRAFR